METTTMSTKMINLLKRFDDELKALLATDLASKKANTLTLEPIQVDAVSSLKIVR